MGSAGRWKAEELLWMLIQEQDVGWLKAGRAVLSLTPISTPLLRSDAAGETFLPGLPRAASLQGTAVCPQTELGTQSEQAL